MIWEGAARPDDPQSEDRPDEIDQPRADGGRLSHCWGSNDADLNRKTALSGRRHFRPDERAAVYRAIETRRDVRDQFLPSPYRTMLIARLLAAAHSAPSVGFMQPWNFIVVRDEDRRQQVFEAFQRANEEAALMFEGAARDTYRVAEARRHPQGTASASASPAIRPAPARSFSAGRTIRAWMPFRRSARCRICGSPRGPKAWASAGSAFSMSATSRRCSAFRIISRSSPGLCLGYVDRLYAEPELAVKGWRQRLPLDELVFLDRWGNR